MVNIDGKHGRRLASAASVPVTTFSAAGRPKATGGVADVRSGADGSTFRVIGPGGVEACVSASLAGAFNVGNALGALVEAGAGLDDAVAGVAACAGGPHGLERVPASGLEVTAFVDYSDKRGAVQAVPSSLRPVTLGILIVVFGCGGDRDRRKRAMMAAAAPLADVAIPASDNPQSEEPLDLPGTADGLSAAAARSRWRMEVHQRADGVTVVNDAYNADPESARAALEAPGHLARDRRGFAVPGHMAELGQSLRAFHEEIGEFAAQVGLAGLIAVKEEAPILAKARRVRSWPGEALGVPDGPATRAVLEDRLNRTRRRGTDEGISRRGLGDRGGRAARPWDDPRSPREGIREADP